MKLLDEIPEATGRWQDHVLTRLKDSPDAQAIAEWLEDIFSRIPAHYQQTIKDRFYALDPYAGFTELVVHEFLLKHGFNVDIEPEQVSRPADFHVRSDSGEEYVVEATCIPSRKDRSIACNHQMQRIIDILNEQQVGELRFNVNLGQPGKPLSDDQIRRALSQPLAEMLDRHSRTGKVGERDQWGVLNPDTCVIPFKGWTISLRLLTGSDRNVTSFSEFGSPDPVSRIRAALLAKSSKNYQTDGKPLLVVVNCMDMTGDLDDFGYALAGVPHLICTGDRTWRRTCQPNGIWIDHSDPERWAWCESSLSAVVAVCNYHIFDRRRAVAAVFPFPTAWDDCPELFPQLPRHWVHLDYCGPGLTGVPIHSIYFES